MAERGDALRRGVRRERRRFKAVHSVTAVALKVRRAGSRAIRESVSANSFRFVTGDSEGGTIQSNLSTEPRTVGMPTEEDSPLLRAFLEALSDHLDGVNLRRVCDFISGLIFCAPGQNVKCLLIFSRERRADDGAWRRNQAKVFSIGTEHLDAGTRR